MPHIVKLQRVGNSCMLTIPSSIMHMIKAHRGDSFVCEIVGDKLVFRNIAQHVVGPAPSRQNNNDRPADFTKELE